MKTLCKKGAEEHWIRKGNNMPNIYLTQAFVASLMTCLLLSCYVCAMVAVDVKIMGHLKPGPREDLYMLMLILFQVTLPICIIHIIFG